MGTELKKQENLYKKIFKSTFLFSFVQIFNIFSKIILNKLIAYLLGSEGIGLMGVFQNLLNILKTFFGFGISESAVRDISKNHQEDEEEKLNQVIYIALKMVWLTSVIGCFFTIIFTPILNKWSFGEEDYLISLFVLSGAVFFAIIHDGQNAILKGTRQLKTLAKVTVYGGALATILSIPFIYFLAKGGIVASLFISSLVLFICSSIAVRKYKKRKKRLPLKQVFAGGRNMVKMGTALMYVSFLGLLSDYVIKVYIGNTHGLETVGGYQVGLTLVTGYFGIIITAMSTDYYPRISAVYDDNKKLATEMNSQSKMGLLFIGPVVILLLLNIEHIIILLYSVELVQAKEYINLAIFGTIFVTCSNAMGMILLAKQKTKIFTISVTFTKGISIVLLIFLFDRYNLSGLGAAMLVMGILHIVLMQVIMFYKFNIKFSKQTLLLLFYTLGISLAAVNISEIDMFWIKAASGTALFVSSLIFSLYQLKTLMNIMVIETIKKKILKR